MSTRFRTIISLVISSSLAIGPAMQASAQSNQNSGNKGCPQVGAAIVGGILGALVGKHNRVAGAAIGAVAATVACAVVNANTRQTKAADTTLQEYKQSNGGQMPDRVILMTYSSNNAPAVSRDGRSEIQISSSGEIAAPPGTRATFTEQIDIYGPGDTNPAKSATKQLSFDTGGGFANSFSIPFQSEYPQGVYTYRTRLVMNGTQVLGEQKGSFQAV